MSWLSFEYQLDLFPIIAVILTAVTCALLGNLLLLRRQSLMGDAISHSILPGIVLAFLFVGTRDPLTMLLGAAAAGLVTVTLISIVHRIGKIESGAAMGVIFSIMFAGGVLLIEQAAVKHTDLDADCVLHGQLETLVWFDGPDGTTPLTITAFLSSVPRQIWTLVAVFLLSSAFVCVFFKELKVSVFDPGLARSMGIHPAFLNTGCITLIALACIASFEAVGSILVIALLICPAATARLWTDTYIKQFVLSIACSIGIAIVGYFGATSIPAAFGKDAVNAAGMIATFNGISVGLSIFIAPRHGLAIKHLRQRRLEHALQLENLLAALFRAHEVKQTVHRLADTHVLQYHKAHTIKRAVRAGLVTRFNDSITPTKLGAARGAEIVRKHRLWETYLYSNAGIAIDHVHALAEQLEHLDTLPPDSTEIDPHGSRIPKPPAGLEPAT